VLFRHITQQHYLEHIPTIFIRIYYIKCFIIGVVYREKIYRSYYRYTQKTRKRKEYLLCSIINGTIGADMGRIKNKVPATLNLT